ncbi:MAG: BrnT family toxin [Gammaproteobacteria bacterium]|nr:BrnT family toxin [Gammaproteobacteria bacterium]
MEFEWHHKKAESNLKKHKIAFYDFDHGANEDREIMIARSENDRVLLVCYTIREDVIRLISVRLATKKEIKEYEAGI